MFYWPVVFLSLIFFKILFRLEAKGKENIPRIGGFILASNHSSYLDPVLLAVSSCPRQLNFMARHDLFTIPIFGAFIRNARAFPVKRDSADIAGIKESLRRLKQTGGLLVFPEGGRSVGQMGMKVESGIGFIAAKSQVPVIPTFINGAGKALGRNARFVKPAKIKIYFGKPTYFKNSGPDKDTYEDFANRIMQDIKRLSQMKA